MEQGGLDGWFEPGRRPGLPPALPIVVINGQVRYRGLFTPTLIARDIDRLLKGEPVDDVPWVLEEGQPFGASPGLPWGRATFRH